MPKGSVQAQRGEARREAIVDAAMRVFATHGFKGGALALVADEVGVSPAGILYHFGSKEDLLLAVIQERDRRAAELGTDLVPTAGLDGLRGLVRYAELSEAEPGLAQLHTVLQIENFEPESPAHKYFGQRSRIVRRNVERMLRHAQSTGEARSDIDPVDYAAQIVAFLEGAAVLWLIDPKVSLVALYRSYIDTLIADVRPGRAPAS